MIVGFNHNVSYRGVGFHVQTEDSGMKSPQLVTLLYHGGTIIASQKTIYADILKVDNLNQVVEDLAREQHKGMLRRLTKGEFDERILALGIALGPSAGKPAPIPEMPADKVAKPAAAVLDEPPEINPMTKPEPEPEPVEIVAEPRTDKFEKPSKPRTSLDELIFAYLSGAER